jgi:hypothetical protein
MGDGADQGSGGDDGERCSLSHVLGEAENRYQSGYVDDPASEPKRGGKAARE